LPGLSAPCACWSSKTEGLHAGKPVSHDELAQHVWDDDDSPNSSVVDVYISFARKRLGGGGCAT